MVLGEKDWWNLPASGKHLHLKSTNKSNPQSNPTQQATLRIEQLKEFLFLGAWNKERQRRRAHCLQCRTHQVTKTLQVKPKKKTIRKSGRKFTFAKFKVETKTTEKTSGKGGTTRRWGKHRMKLRMTDPYKSRSHELKTEESKRAQRKILNWKKTTKEIRKKYWGVRCKWVATEEISTYRSQGIKSGTSIRRNKSLTRQWRNPLEEHTCLKRRSFVCYAWKNTNNPVQQ